MSENIKQRYNATTQTTTSNPFRNIDLSDGSPALDGDVIVFGGVCDTTGAAVDFATQTTLAAIAVDAAAMEVLLGTIDTGTGAIATSAASIDTKTPALGQALAAASVPVVLTAAQVSTLTPPAAITGFATESTLGTLSAKFATGTVIGDVNLGATDNAVLDAIAASAAAIQAGQLPDSHNVTIDNASVAVTGTFWQATQPVSGTVAVTGTQTDALTDTQLRATAVPVSGTVTAELSATDNAVLDAIAASVAGTLTVGSHAVTNAGTFAVQVTSAPTTAVTGTFWQATQPVSLASVPTHAVTVASGGVASGAIASGAFASGSIAAGAVAAGATSFVKLEDAASANADAGVPSMAVRKATPANTSGTDGDYEMLQMSAGRLWTSATIDAALPAGTNNIGDVDVLSLPALPTGTNSIGQVTANAGTNLNTSALALESGGNLATIRGAVYNDTLTSGWGVNGVQMLGYSEDMGGPSTLTLDDAGMLKVVASIGATLTVQGSVAHDGVITAEQPFLVAGYASAAAPSDVSGDGDAVRAWHLRNGSPVCNLAVGGTLVTASAGLPVAGGVAHDGADSGSPHKQGARAKGSLSAITLVAADDRTDLFAGLDGIQIVRPHSPLEDLVSGVAAITDGSSTSVIAAQGAGVKTYITSVTIANTSATAVTVDLRDGTAGSVKWTFPVPADTAGVVHTFPTPLGFSANTIVAADPSAAASTVTVSLSGFRSKV